MAEAVVNADRTRASARRPSGLRALGWFWAATLLALAAGAVTLQILGPVGDAGRPTLHDSARAHGSPPPEAHAGADAQHGTEPIHGAAAGHGAESAHAGQDAHAPDPGAEAAPATPGHAEAASTEPHDPAAQHSGGGGGEAASHPPADTVAPGASAAIRAPDPALLEVAPTAAPARLPRIAADGRMPRLVYAARFDPAERRPRVAILLGGIGQSESDTEEASRSLPAAVSFVVSPYTMRPERVLDGIRARGHEMLVGLPMEPLNYPVNDEGNASLLTFAPIEQNEQRLDWALSRIEGYVGATNALDGLRGERFSAATASMGSVLRQLAARGLIYVDAAPGASRMPRDLPALPMRAVDTVVDEPAVRSEIDAKLAQLEQLARDRGSALGLAGLPRPVTLSRLAAWATSLDQHGVALVPVTQLAALPAKRDDPQAGPAEAAR